MPDNIIKTFRDETKILSQFLCVWRGDLLRNIKKYRLQSVKSRSNPWALKYWFSMVLAMDSVSLAMKERIANLYSSNEVTNREAPLFAAYIAAVKTLLLANAWHQRIYSSCKIHKKAWTHKTPEISKTKAQFGLCPGQWKIIETPRSALAAQERNSILVLRG